MLPKHTVASFGLAALFIVAATASADVIGNHAPATPAPVQRLALIVTKIVDGAGEPVVEADVALIRCRGPRRFTLVPSFEAANTSGVPVQSDRDNCDVVRTATDAEGVAKFRSVKVGDIRTPAGRDSTVTYLIRSVKDGYTGVRHRITPHVARNEVDLVMYRTAGERMFELVEEAKGFLEEQDFGAAEGAMIQSVAMMTAEVSVRFDDTPEVLLEAMRFLAYVQLAGGNDIAAADTLNELLQLSSSDEYALRTSGVIAVRTRDWRTARARFGAYIEHHPDSADAHLMMGNLLLETGDVQGAVAELEGAADLDPQSAMAFRSLGMAHEQSGNLSEAVNCFARYLALAGEPADAGHIRATIAALQRNS